MKTKVSSRGQIVLPAELRAVDKIKPGQVLQVERVRRGEYRLVRLAATNDGVVDWLLSCPESGWFTAIDSESTDDL